VPGVLSSGRGRDFGAFLGALGELGYGWAYRVLDAQWVRTQRHPRAVPQRRRRVFVVGCLGDWRAAAEVLLESESVQRDSPKKRASGKNIAADAAPVARGGCYWNGEQVAAAMTRKGCDDRMPDKQRLFAVLQPVPFRKSKRAQSATDDESWVEADQANTLNQFDTGERDTHAVAFTCKDHGADAGFVSPTLRAMPHYHTHANGGGQVAVAQPINDLGWCRDHSPTITARMQGSSGWAPYNEDAHLVSSSMTVRRLTPRECERLQGFPDDWTLIPWRKREAIDCPDGPRYKALGNSMAVNCMEWIGERISAREARCTLNTLNSSPRCALR